MVIQTLLAVVCLASSSGFAQVVPEPEIREGSALHTRTLEESLKDIGPGQIVVLGEEHGTAVHQNYQLRVLEFLRNRGLLVSVGMEFLEATDQHLVDQYRQGLLSEMDFLAAIHWAGFPFEFYRAQIQFPTLSEATVALNVSKKVTSKIAKQGVGSLLPEDLAQLPPNFVSEGRGNDLYFERFRAEMSGHLTDPTKLENYFLAQSAWDDVMSWHADRYLKAHPSQVLVIIVGDFHVRYGGGLPDRLRKRGHEVATISMINTKGLTKVETSESIDPNTTNGIRADWIWLSEF